MELTRSCDRFVNFKCLTLNKQTKLHTGVVGENSEVSFLQTFDIKQTNLFGPLESSARNSDFGLDNRRTSKELPIYCFQSL